MQTSTLTSDQQVHIFNMIVRPQLFEELATDIWYHGRPKADMKKTVFDKKFRSFFGVTAFMMDIIWSKLEKDRLLFGAGPKHLLWTFMFLKIYVPQIVLAHIAQCDRKTFSFWTRKLVHSMAKLDVVS